MSTKWLLYWVLVVLTLGLYGTMVFWSLPLIAQNAAELIPFDMRPSGYNLQEARTFLEALTPEGKAFYRNTQLRLDAAYPAMLAVVLALGGMGLACGRWRWIGYIVVISAVLGAAADYVENTAIASILAIDPVLLTTVEVDFASRATLVKSGSTTIAMSLLLLLLVVRWMKRKRAS